MKNTNILKSFSDLPSATTHVTDASLPTILELSAPPGHPTDEDFREMLRQRASAPFSSAIPYQHWGLNE